MLKGVGVQRRRARSRQKSRPTRRSAASMSGRCWLRRSPCASSATGSTHGLSQTGLPASWACTSPRSRARKPVITSRHWPPCPASRESSGWNFTSASPPTSSSYATLPKRPLARAGGADDRPPARPGARLGQAVSAPGHNQEGGPGNGTDPSSHINPPADPLPCCMTGTVQVTAPFDLLPPPRTDPAR
jgi:hypothetical protein